MDPLTARERHLTAQDGLRLFYRDWGDPLAPGVPVLCLAGLVRNSRDFEELAAHLAPKRRVLALDLRGRGRSAHDRNPLNYAPATYVMDIVALLTAANVDKVVVIGTSLGGLLSMALALARPAGLAGIVLNDIGPEIDPRGVARIRGYVGKQPAPKTLPEAAQLMQRNYGAAFPDFTEADWTRQAERTYRKLADGSLALDYDPAIARSIANGPEVDLWRVYRGLADQRVLAFRGALSDILSEATFDRMADLKPDLIRVTVPNRGHTPMLTEPACLAAIDEFLARIDAAHA